MKTNFLFILFFISSFLFCQEVIQSNDVYFEGNHAYKVKDSQLFTGFVEFKNGKNYIVQKEEYNNGIIQKQINYYKFSSLKKYIPYEIIVFKNNKKFSKTTFHSTEEKSSYSEFDENGKKKFYEEYKDGKTVLTQNFKNGKLDGKVSCFDKKGIFQEHFYKEGKLIK